MLFFVKLLTEPIFPLQRNLSKQRRNLIFEVTNTILQGFQIFYAHIN